MEEVSSSSNSSEDKVIDKRKAKDDSLSDNNSIDNGKQQVKRIKLATSLSHSPPKCSSTKENLLGQDVDNNVMAMSISKADTTDGGTTMSMFEEHEGEISNNHGVVEMESGRFKLPEPKKNLTENELENENNNSNSSDEFYSGIKVKYTGPVEESSALDKLRQAVPRDDEKDVDFGSSILNNLDQESILNNVIDEDVSDKDNFHFKRPQNSSEVSPIEDSYFPQPHQQPIEFEIKIYNIGGAEPFYISERIRTDYPILSDFFKNHGQDFKRIYQNSVNSSGYSADIDSQSGKEDSQEMRVRRGGLLIRNAQNQLPLMTRLSTFSTISSISQVERHSMATTVGSNENHDHDIIMEEEEEERLLNNNKTPQNNTNRRRKSPLLSSTKIEKSVSTFRSTASDKQNITSEDFDSDENNKTSNSSSSRNNTSLSNGRSYEDKSLISISSKTPTSTIKPGRGRKKAVKNNDSSDNLNVSSSSSASLSTNKKKIIESQSHLKSSTPTDADKSNNTGGVSEKKNPPSTGTGRGRGRPRVVRDTPSSEKAKTSTPSSSVNTSSKITTKSSHSSSSSVEATSDARNVTGSSSSTSQDSNSGSLSNIYSSEDDEVNINELDKSTTIFGSVGPTELVFARWNDRNYYSGKIKEKGLNDTWVIAFEDNTEYVASESHIIPMKLLGVGIKAIYCPDGVYQPANATIIGQKMKEDKILYAIDCADKERPIFCERRHLSIKEVEAKKLRKEYVTIIDSNLIKKASDISVVNLIDTPRSRSAVSSASKSNTNKQPEVIRRKKIVGGAFDESTSDEIVFKSTPKTLSKKVDPKKLAVSSSESYKSSSNESGRDNDDDLKVKGYPDSSPNTHTPKTSLLAAKKSPTKDPKNKTYVKELGEISPPSPSHFAKPSSPTKKDVKNGKLFEHISFFLTASGGGDPSSSGLSISAPVLSYDKEEYSEKIESKGGHIVDSVGKEKKAKKKDDTVFLISDSHARTVKYIYSLAAGIPVLSFKWIDECIEKNRIVPWEKYELNAGWSIEQHKVIPNHRERPLKDLKIYVISDSAELYNYWRPVLHAAQAKLLKPLRSANKFPEDTQVLVTDSSCSEAIRLVAAERELPVVKPEWLVQTIISGRKVNYVGHEKYLVTDEGARSPSLLTPGK